ncbi:MAG: methylmalonyl-CoA mutase family protein [Gammaproteobacteria bacterium]|nr:methylmalonyl-CoA mutase family protein [Gammaproteobacteria bacterium]
MHKAGTPRPLRLVSAAALFDGHDAAINLVRRLLQAHGAEVVHLGHNRGVEEIVRAAIQEDADAIAVSSYQGGHNEYFRYLIDRLREQDAAHIRVVVGGGGTIAPEEIAALEAYGVEKIYTPEDGRRLGLEGMIEDVLARIGAVARPAFRYAPPAAAAPRELAAAITELETDGPAAALLRRAIAAAPRRAPVLGVTGTGGAGKSSLNDELLQRFVHHFPGRRIAVIAMDPTRRRSGGALLGDRIRMNALASPDLYMRSLATRRQHRASSAALGEIVGLMQFAGFDLVIVETAGTGQADSEIVDIVDVPVYVMTSEYGAPSQLEKIDMLDYAEFVVLNKAEKSGAEDALRDIRKQWRRNHPAEAGRSDSELPVYATVASRFNDPGVNRLFAALCVRLAAWGAVHDTASVSGWQVADPGPIDPDSRGALIPAARDRYLGEIAALGRAARAGAATQAQAARQACGHYGALQALADTQLPEPLQPYAPAALTDPSVDASLRTLRGAYNAALEGIGVEGRQALAAWPGRCSAVQVEQYSYDVRGQSLSGANYTVTPSHNRIPKIAVPSWRDWGEILHFLLSENLPGSFPYTAGVYPYRREAEEPTRMFAGEGGPERTNCRFHLLAAGHAATRLSTAFDSTTLYGEDPDTRPDIYGRTGNSGVSTATLDDVKKLYSGFDLCAPTTSVSLTINGPAPIVLAMFLNAAIDQRVEQHLKSAGRWREAQVQISERRAAAARAAIAWPTYTGALPPTHTGLGLGLLGVSGDELVDAASYARLRGEALAQVRGTVQADILKEEQAQNTCIFSTEFGLRMMADVQQYFIAQGVRNFYSVSVSGYHIAEAGANPVSQLAFTLANGFTLLEYYLARGMRVDEVAPSLSFFFSNGMDAEYAVIGRVARRIWARALRDRYQAAPRSQMLKYHIQTSGRSLHAREIQFNDIRTTLQALCALFDNCNSLHTNAYDEALTTPTEESVRRAVAIQLIINRELGLNASQNPWQGSFLVQYLTDLVEEAVYREFDALAARGGVLGAMETLYQRGRIQEESLLYEQRKHDGTLPIVGVNTFLSSRDATAEQQGVPLIRSTEAEKQAQVANLRAFQARHAGRAATALARLQQVASGDGNVFAELMETVKVCSLGQITGALYRAGGRYRRSI